MQLRITVLDRKSGPKVAQKNTSNELILLERNHASRSILKTNLAYWHSRIERHPQPHSLPLGVGPDRAFSPRPGVDVSKRICFSGPVK